VQFEYLCSSDVISLSRCFFRGSISISSGLRNSAVILSGDIHQNSTIVSNQATYSWSGECDPRIANAELIDGLPTNCNDLRDLRNGYSLANVILLASLAGCILLDFIIVFFKLRTDQPTRPPANNRVLAFFISLLKLLPLSCAVLPLAGTIISILILYGLDYSSNALYQVTEPYLYCCMCCLLCALNPHGPCAVLSELLYYAGYTGIKEFAHRDEVQLGNEFLCPIDFNSFKCGLCLCILALPGGIKNFQIAEVREQHNDIQVSALPRTDGRCHDKGEL